MTALVIVHKDYLLFVLLDEYKPVWTDKSQKAEPQNVQKYHCF